MQSRTSSVAGGLRELAAVGWVCSENRSPPVPPQADPSGEPSFGVSGRASGRQEAATLLRSGLPCICRGLAEGEGGRLGGGSLTPSTPNPLLLGGARER